MIVKIAPADCVEPKSVPVWAKMTRTLSFLLSATRTFPCESSANPMGLFSSAVVAGDASMLNPATPVPATV